ncbi:MAG: hypothetical protein AAF740_12945, partial [Bacteroidota bacterium]
MKYILLALLFTLDIAVFSQQEGTTSKGRKVILNDDGTWRYAEEEEGEPQETSYIFIGGERLVSGEGAIIHPREKLRQTSTSSYSYSSGYPNYNYTPPNQYRSNDSDRDEMITSVTVAKKGSRTMIIFSQETGGSSNELL